jgi:putative tryptophan/tyrosine transport system substrate-binding protein
MRRREFIAFVGSTAVAWPLAVRAQQTDHMRRLGVLFSITEADAEGQARVAALKLGLLEHGWIEGRNLEINYRWGGGDTTQLRAYAAELTAQNSDVIFRSGRPARILASARLLAKKTSS